jgi:hypothetical protein
VVGGWRQFFGSGIAGIVRPIDDDFALEVIGFS